MGPVRAAGNAQKRRITIAMKLFDKEGVVRLLRTEVKRAGAQSLWAKQKGVSRTLVNKVLNGRATPSKRMIKALKLRIIYISEQ